MLNKRIVCALDTPDLQEACLTINRLRNHVSTFKIGHALTLNHGLDVIDHLHEAGAERIFLDLKFHDIPNSVAVAVREAAKRKVWMTTVHIAGGPAMLNAAVEEARNVENPPLIVGVSVLTSLDQRVLTDHLGVQRTIEEHMVYLSKLAIDCDLDGIVCSPHEIKAIRGAIGRNGIIVTPGIRLPGGDSHDQQRFGSAQQALDDGADYLVVGRALTACPDPQAALKQLELSSTGA